MADAERKYTDEEFTLILRKASQIQDRGGGADTETGLSIEEIQAIAREVGIDPVAVERAAALVPRTASRDALARFMGGPIRYRLETTVRSTLSEEDQARLLDAVRRAAEHHGKAGYGPGGFEWSTVGEVSQIHATVSPMKDGACIRVTADRGGAVVLTLFFSLVQWLVTAGITGAVIDPSSTAVGVAIVSGGFLAGLVQSRLLWARTTRTIREKLQRVMAALTEATEDEETPSGASD